MTNDVKRSRYSWLAVYWDIAISHSDRLGVLDEKSFEPFGLLIW